MHSCNPNYLRLNLDRGFKFEKKTLKSERAEDWGVARMQLSDKSYGFRQTGKILNGYSFINFN